MGSRSEAKTQSQQQDNKLGASDIDGNLVQVGAGATYTNEFSPEVASAFSEALSLVRDTVTGAGAVIAKSVDNISETRQLQTTGQVASANQTMTRNVLIGSGLIGAALLLSKK